MSEEYALQSLEVPQEASDAARRFDREIQRRSEDRLHTRTAQLKAQQRKFRTPEEARASVAQEIAELEKRLLGEWSDC